MLSNLIIYVQTNNNEKLSAVTSSNNFESLSQVIFVHSILIHRRGCASSTACVYAFKKIKSFNKLSESSNIGYGLDCSFNGTICH